MQHNVKSLRTNKDLLDHYLQKNDIDIAILSEIWLKPEEQIRIKNYTIQQESRPHGYGGVAVVLRDHIRFSKKLNNSFSPIEFIEIETTNLIENIKIISIYIPPRTSINHIKSKFKLLLNTYNSCNNTLIAGDINAHNTLWESEHSVDAKGEIIAELINESNFLVLNNEDHTYQSEISGKTSALDITLVHTNIARNFDWSKNFENLYSDHFIININYYTHKSTSAVNVTKQFINYKTLERDILHMDTSQITSIDSYERELVRLTDLNTTLLNEQNKYVSKYWWNEKIKRLWLIKNEKMKLFNTKQTIFTKIEFKKHVAKLKIEIKRSKRLKFQEFKHL